MENGYTSSIPHSCCYKCKYANGRYQLALTCGNRKAWEKETSVEPVGRCRFYYPRDAKFEEVRNG